MSPASSKKTFCTFSTFNQLLPSVWSFPGILEGSKHNSGETRQRPKMFPKLSLISLLSTTGKLFHKLSLKSAQKHTCEKILLNARQFDFRADTSMHAAGGSRYPKFQQ
jgi:hypothetical protein